MTTITLRTEAKISEEYLRLVAYVDRHDHGEMLTYESVTANTGIPMTRSNRDKLRRAILRTGREYSVVPQVGYQLADIRTALPILVSKLGRISSTVRRADKAQRRIQHHFLKEMPREQKEHVLFIGSIFATIENAAKTGRQLYGENNRQALVEPVVIVPGITPDLT